MDCVWRTTNERLASYQQFTNLLVLRLSSRLSSLQATPDIGILLSKLRTASFHFHLDECDPQPIRPSIEGIIQIFDMPALEAFSIDHDHVAVFYGCLPHSSPRLKILRVKFRFTPSEEDDAKHALGMFPELTELFIEMHLASFQTKSSSASSHTTINYPWFRS
ncbi:hypothetical protein C8R43DRAFT_297656 [Mycena crocata]|nr:hypothetical protein C8R43DRAFT_297656 [Mycena crocata]